MVSVDALRRRLETGVRVWVDAVGYAAAVTAVTLLLAGTAGVATGTGAVGSKLLLFVAGWGLMGYATVKLWPRSPEEGEAEQAVPERHDRTRFQAAVQALPPVRWVEAPPPTDRMTLAGKLLLSSLLVLLASFLMEAVFGVGVQGG